MNRTLMSSLAAGVLAVAALAAPAQAGYKSHFHGHHVKVHHVHHFHKFHAYRPVHFHYVPVCVKHAWVHSYGHKKWACVFWK
ncbi:MAG: hypothetical protein SFW09_10850 [Hyphomicrobiaceae bacterium]|nr:hypothetical protein [Hyphomicrobiaceae bacterium]